MNFDIICGFSTIIPGVVQIWFQNVIYIYIYKHGYGSIPTNIIFRGMNIHLHIPVYYAVYIYLYIYNVQVIYYFKNRILGILGKDFRRIIIFVEWTKRETVAIDNQYIHVGIPNPEDIFRIYIYMYVYIHKLRLRKHPKISGIPAMFNQIWWMMVEKYVFNIWNKYGYMGCVD